ncbi:tRNA pseudouridine(55) synthase TruB [Uliginosibacterium sp. sgz301328]|uniref:tRNA pseudouridine(55) synthase TruB n=1 Tax=Uliginosibacterium sp. sgz301328 TaxID=3243764 RepID=UPI00359CD522
MSKASMRRRWQQVDGVLLLDKPRGLSSNDALQKARRVFQAAKAGHTGTLDPLATGLLPVLFGEATKFSNLLLDSDKTYEATLQLGVTTTTGDAEGEVLDTRPVTVDEAAIRAVCARFIGPISQVPPMYSALKYEGKPLYEYARQGIHIERPAREITIHALDVRRVAGSQIDIVVHCSKGTYIRTLAADIGAALACGAHLTALRRTQSGGLDVADAYTLEGLLAIEESARSNVLRPVDSLLAHLPRIDLEPALATRFGHGQALRAPIDARGPVRVYGERFIGTGVIDEGGALRPQRLVSQIDTDAD